eukprot:COSAG02_NODE_18498_length_935_cov_0.991627_1_plen_82_part_00
MEDQSKIELNTIKTKILHEIPYIDIKPFSHNIISLELRLISEKYGIHTANQVIEDFALDVKGWHKIIPSDSIWIKWPKENT